MIDIKEHFKNAQDLSESELSAARITAKELIEIYYDYLESLKELEIEGAYLSNRLQFFKNINSVRWRTKDPIHLLTKIVRKRKEAIEQENISSKYLSINVNNYKEIITDLLGLRAIYLFKFQWELVDNYICNNFKISPDEKITIYHAPEDDLTFYYEDGHEKKVGEINLKYSRVKRDSKYRSTHYIAETNFPHNFKLEIQIRSILDEAWGEIDHYIRYPNHQDDEELKRQMTVLNGAINGCEELSTTYIGKFREKSFQAVQEIFLEEQGLSESFEDDKNTIEEKVTIDRSVESSQKILQDLAVESDLSRLTIASGIRPEIQSGLSAANLATIARIKPEIYSGLSAANLAAVAGIRPEIHSALSAANLAAVAGRPEIHSALSAANLAAVAGIRPEIHSSLSAANLAAVAGIRPEIHSALSAANLAAVAGIRPEIHSGLSAANLAVKGVSPKKKVPVEKNDDSLSEAKKKNSQED